MDFIRHRGADEEVDDARPPTLTPGTKNALDDLADVLSSVKLRGDTPPARAGGPTPRSTRTTPPRTAAVGAASVYAQRATASHASVASPVRRSPRRAPPHTPPSVDADEGSAHLLAGVLAKAATSPLPLSSEPPSSSSPRFRPRKDTKERRDESAKPKLVVRYKREAVAPAAGSGASAASAASDASASASFVSASASFASERLATSGNDEGSSRAVATEATAAVLARASSIASAASSSAASSAFRPKGTEEEDAAKDAAKDAASAFEKEERKPNRRGAELRASLPHSTPTRKARSKRDTRPRHSETSSRLSAFATFREQRRSALAEKNARKKASSSPNARARPEELADRLGGDDGALFKDAEVDALADALAAGVTLDVTPSRRTPARALALADPKDGLTQKTVGLCYSDVMELHAGPAFHFERPARHAETVERFKRRGLESRCVPIEARPATDAELLLVHSQTHLDAVRTTFDASSDGAETQGEGDIYWTKHTEKCARVAAGSAAAAALAVASGALHRAFAVVRPPGHHAECARAMGFCFFNNTVIAARAALTAYPERIKKILLVDWDVHHGNGIQDLTYDDDAILYVSLHRRQEGFYPETGDAEEIGIGKGRGYNVNVPWPEKGLSDADYLAAFDLLVLPVASAFAPDLVIVAAGYDAAEGDPLGGMRVSDQGFALMTERLQALAGGRIVCALEGGYGLTATANAAAATLGAMLGFNTPALGRRRRPRRSTVELLRSMCEGDLAECWPVLRSPAHLELLREAARGTTPGEPRAKERADEKRALLEKRSPVSDKISEKPSARPTVFAVPVPATPTRRAATPT